MPEDQLSLIIKKYLDIQEGKRKILWKLFKMSLFYSIAFILIASIATDYLLYTDLSTLFGFMGLGYLIYVGIVKTKKYKEEYTRSFIEPLMKHLYPGMTYEQKNKVDEEIFDKSGLFPTQKSFYRGEDLFKVKMDVVTVGFSEISTGKSKKSSNKNSSSTNHFYLRGLFFYIAGNFNVYEPYYIRNINTIVSIRQTNDLKTAFELKKKSTIKNPDYSPRFELWVEPNRMSDPEIPDRLLHQLGMLEDHLKSISAINEISFSVQSKMIGVSLQPMKIFEPPIFKPASDLQSKLERNLSIIEELINLRHIFTN